MELFDGVRVMGLGGEIRDLFSYYWFLVCWVQGLGFMIVQFELYLKCLIWVLFLVCWVQGLGFMIVES